MLVSGPHGSHWRGSTRATIKRNGSFIDIFFDDDGIQRFIAVPEKDLQTLLAMEGYNPQMASSVDLDIPADIHTVIKEFLGRTVVRQIQNK